MAKAGIYRTLGHAVLCGVLHVAYQTRTTVQGEYMLCILFESYMLLATASEDLQQFHVAVCMHVADIKIETTEDGKGKLYHRFLDNMANEHRAAMPYRTLLVEDSL